MPQTPKNVKSALKRTINDLKTCPSTQRGQPLLLDAVAGNMGQVMDLKIYLLGCIRVTWKVKNQP